MKHNRVIRFLIVRVLHRMTAQAFGVPFRGGIPALRAYALFTRERINEIPEEDLPAVQERMYLIAFGMGRRIRKILWIRTEERARRIVFWLYRCIDIELEGECPGAISVPHCFFSGIYTPKMCQVMSAMDRGIFSGIFGGGELCFEARITEGCPCCRAVFALKKGED